ncbi:MAG TPA: effector-associated domain EAD1-containing protein [Pyrinomonadaceae bacterium]|nr:effector-associated domain EAD1-containing protein [Pyrinomonadaceae bacterium]
MDIILELTPAEVEQFQTALLSTFPNRGDLEQLVYFRLGQDSYQIVSGGNYANYVTNLIIWANAEGKAWALLSAAHDKVPGNPKLRGFYQRIKARLAPPVPTPPPNPDFPEALIKDLINALLDMAHVQIFEGRTNLLAGLPGITGFTRDQNNARSDLEGIVAQLQRLGRLSSGEWPLLMLVDNALPYVKGYAVGDQLAKVRQRLVQFYQEV